MGGDGDSGRSVVTISVRCTNGSKFSVETALDATVEAFKAVIAERSDVPAAQQRLIYKGRILKDDQTLASYGIESDHAIHMVRGAAPQTSPANTGAANTGVSAAGNNSPRAARGAGGAFGSEGLDIPLFPGLGANGGLLGAGFPGLEQMQQQLTQNPNMMRELMNLPVIQNMMNNPDLMRNLIMSSPQMREIMDRNPELAHVLNDPSTLRQTLEAARNPEIMRELMRNTDRAMSNIESSPEGFNMLRRMYETVQEPFLNAATMSGDTGSNTESNPFAALLGNQGVTQTRGQPLSTGSGAATDSPAPNTNPLPNPWGNAGGTPTNNSRSTGNTGTPSIAGLGGLSIPELADGLNDTAMLNQFVQNPAVSQMMQSLLSDPQYMNQILNMSPQLRSAMETNPQLREMLQNPEFLQQLTSPEALQHIMSLQSLFSQFSRQPSSQGQNTTGGTAGMPNNSMDLLMNMFGSLGAGVLGVPNPSNLPPEELYATQLSQLREMGFYDTQENIRVLSATAGNVHAAVERLLGNLGQ